MVDVVLPTIDDKAQSVIEFPTPPAIKFPPSVLTIEFPVPFLKKK